MSGKFEKKTHVPYPHRVDAAERFRMKDVVKKDFEISLSIIRNIKLSIETEIELDGGYIYSHSIAYLIKEAEELIGNLKKDYEDIVCLGGFDHSFAEASKILDVK